MENSITVSANLSANSGLTPIDQALHQDYADEYPCWPLIGMAAAFNAIAIPGMAMNFGVVWVTARTSALRGTANFLLALLSLLEMLAGSGNLFFLWTALSREHFVDARLAFYILVVPLLGLFGSTMALACIAFDRLLAVFFPFKYLWMKRSSLYLGLLTTVCALFALYILALNYGELTPAKRVSLLGELGMQSRVGTRFGLSAYSLTVAIYVLIGLKMRFRKQVDSSAGDQTQRKFFRALLFVVFINVGGYFVAMLWLVVVVPWINGPQLELWWCTQLGGLLFNVSSGSNGPVLHLTSEDYRKAFRREMGRLTEFLVGPPNTVQPLQRRNNPTAGNGNGRLTEVC